MCEHNHDIIERITSEPNVFVLRFAPGKQFDDNHIHSPVWYYTLECGISGLVWSDTEINALERLNDEYTNDARIVSFVRIDDDQNIFEIKKGRR